FAERLKDRRLYPSFVSRLMAALKQITFHRGYSFKKSDFFWKGTTARTPANKGPMATGLRDANRPINGQMGFFIRNGARPSGRPSSPDAPECSMPRARQRRECLPPRQW